MSLTLQVEMVFAKNGCFSLNEVNSQSHNIIFINFFKAQGFLGVKPLGGILHKIQIIIQNTVNQGQIYIWTYIITII